MQNLRYGQPNSKIMKLSLVVVVFVVVGFLGGGKGGGELGGGGVGSGVAGMIQLIRLLL